MGQVCNCFSKGKYYNDLSNSSLNYQKEKEKELNKKLNGNLSNSETLKKKSNLSININDNFTRRIKEFNLNDTISPIKHLKEEATLLMCRKPRKNKISLNVFSVEKCIGKGTFGKVLLVRHLEKQKLFAMKMIRKTDIMQNQLETNIVN